MDIPKLENLNSGNCTSTSIEIHYLEFYKYIRENYGKVHKWTEKLYWYYHNLTEYPTCPICGKPVKFINLKEGYRGYCSVKCMGGSKEIKEKKKNTTLKHYGVENPMKSDKVKDKMKSNNLEKYGVENPFQLDSVKEQIRKTNQEKYGVDYPQQSKEIYKKSKQTNKEKYDVEYHAQNEKIKRKKIQTSLEKYGVESPFQSDEFKKKSRETCLDKYGVDNYNKTQEYRDMMQERMPEIRKKMMETCMEKYGVDSYSKTEKYKNLMNKKRPEILKKQYDTKKQNGTFNSSSIEESFNKWLMDNNIKFERQYRSDKYPFNCDFYFPDKDLYFEIQGSWTHGPEPYDPSNSDHQELLEMMMEKVPTSEYYENAITVWTMKDPLKRETAKKNGLNWVEVFSCDLDEVIDHYKKAINH